MAVRCCIICRLLYLEEAAAASSLWDDRAKAQQTLKPFTDVEEKIELLNDFKERVYTSIL